MPEIRPATRLLAATSGAGVPAPRPGRQPGLPVAIATVDTTRLRGRAAVAIMLVSSPVASGFPGIPANGMASRRESFCKVPDASGRAADCIPGLPGGARRSSAVHRLASQSLSAQSKTTPGRQPFSVQTAGASGPGPGGRAGEPTVDDRPVRRLFGPNSAVCPDHYGFLGMERHADRTCGTALWHEPADTQRQKPGFEERHNLAHAGNGFLLPKLAIAPSSGRIHLVAKRREPAHASISFVEEVDTCVEPEELRLEFQRLIDFVLRRLDREEGFQLSEAWAAINDLDPEEREFSRVAAMCGVDPFDVEDTVSEAIIAFWERIEPSIREEALAAADVHSLPRLGDWLVDAVEDPGSVGNQNRWNEIRDHIPVSHVQEPWKQGCELAQSVRNMLEPGQGPFQFESEGPLAVFHEERTSPSRRIEGIVAATRPACVTVSGSHGSGTRFLKARALGEFVGRREPRMGILGSLHNDRQARSRAFAAEFLAPAAVLCNRFDNCQRALPVS